MKKAETVSGYQLEGLCLMLMARLYGHPKFVWDIDHEQKRILFLGVEWPEFGVKREIVPVEGWK